MATLEALWRRSLCSCQISKSIPEIRFSHRSLVSVLGVFGRPTVACTHVLSAEPSTTAETLAVIWSELVHSLRSMWESTSSSSSRVPEEKRAHFLRIWGHTSIFFTLQEGRPQWIYTPPQWFHLHTSYQSPMTCICSFQPCTIS